jgi:hypothetical protein
MSKDCKNCKHWQVGRDQWARKVKDSDQEFPCAVLNGKKDLVYADENLFAEFRTAPDFGCKFFKKV